MPAPRHGEPGTIAWDGFRTNQTFFTDVRVPKTNLLGEVNRGWQYITGALDLERGALTNAGDLRRVVDDIIAPASLTLADGTRPVDSPDVRRKIAQLDADVETCVLMSAEAASLLEDGEIPTTVVTEEKTISSELRQRIADVGTQLRDVIAQRAHGMPGYGR
ncbi:MAG TPA: acyl-CoA dehydrogenase family protein [Trebonia sp.]|jgi:alkylation response protein AidB-like acyl-CoA dehydrogenase